jgi:hypothetical protein
MGPRRGVAASAAGGPGRRPHRRPRRGFDRRRPPMVARGWPSVRGPSGGQPRDVVRSRHGRPGVVPAFHATTALRAEPQRGEHRVPDQPTAAGCATDRDAARTAMERPPRRRPRRGVETRRAGGCGRGRAPGARHPRHAGSGAIRGFFERHDGQVVRKPLKGPHRAADLHPRTDAGDARGRPSPADDAVPLPATRPRRSSPTGRRARLRGLLVRDPVALARLASARWVRGTPRRPGQGAGRSLSRPCSRPWD